MRAIPDFCKSRPVILLLLLSFFSVVSVSLWLLVQRPKIVIGSKSFTESAILGEMLVQLVREKEESVGHRRGLGGTRILWAALVRGQIDVYPDYTGTISDEVLNDPSLRDDDAIRTELAKHGIQMSQPLGYGNSYAIGMRKDRAARLGITKVSDLRDHSELKFGFTNEFMKRADGWPGLKARYQLPQTDVRGLEHVLAYPALDRGELDATDVYTTDAEIGEHDLKILEDDLRHFPPYRAVLLYRADLEQRAPEVLANLLRLEGKLTELDMVKANGRTMGDKKESESVVAADLLAEKLERSFTGRQESGWERLAWNTANHLLLVTISLSAAILVAIPLGILSARRPVTGQVILSAAGIVQTIPSLALLFFMVLLLGGKLGAPPAIVALFLYSLLPIVRNTYTGLHDISIQVRESAEALGLPDFARLRLVELPIAARSILAGIKTSAVINVGTATLGGLIGAGGYGQPIFEGLRRNDHAEIFLQGALPAAVMALLVQGLFELAERRLVPKGLRLKVEAE